MSMLERNPNQSIESTDDKAIQIEHLQQEYRTLEERHKVLNSIVPQWEECIGIIQEMTRLERAMKAIWKRLKEIKAVNQAV